MKNNILLTLLVLTTSLTIMSLDLYIPSLPYLPEYFSTTEELVKLTVGLNSLTYGLGTLLYGPLSERFGRRKILLGAMFCFTGATIFCAFSASIQQLISARILLGFAAAAEGVLVYSIISDFFKGRQQVKAFSVWHAACAWVPIFAPILGAYIFLHYGWRANFLLLSIIASCVTLLLWLYLPEHTKANDVKFSMRKMLMDYSLLFKSRTFLSLAVLQSTGVGYFIAFPTAIPFILDDQFNKPPEFYGYYQGAIILFFMLGAIVTRALVNRLLPTQVLEIGVLVVASGAALLMLQSTFGSPDLLLLSLALSLLAFGNGFVFTTVPPLAMNVTASSAGVSAALLLTVQSVLGSLTSIADGIFNNGTIQPFAIILSVVAFVALLSCFIGLRGRSHLLVTDTADNVGS